MMIIRTKAHSPLTLLKKTVMLTLVLAGLMTIAQAQSHPVFLTYSPEDGWENEQDVELSVAYGNEDSYPEEVTQVEVTIQLEGARVAPHSRPEIEGMPNSWFTGDGQWSGETYVERDGQIVRLLLTRQPNSPAGGYGELCRLKGLTLEIEEIRMKDGPAISAIGHHLHQVDIFWESATQELSVEGASDAGVLRVVDMSGRIVYEGASRNGAQISLPPSNLYAVVVIDQGVVVATRKISVLR